MRIIAGRFKRRTLKTNPGLTTRPMTDRVKESLFERLGDVISEAAVADVFAGTGTLGLEALSRGAKHVTFIERDRKAVELLRENVAKLQVDAETLIWPADVMKCSFRPKGKAAPEPWDLVFFDPPYRFVRYIQPGDRLYAALERLARAQVTKANAILVFRTPARAEFLMPKPWTEQWCLSRAGMEIHVLGKQESTEDRPPP